MKEKEFNLLEEPWIRVRRPDCTIGEVSLTDALLGAHAYAGLAGELPTQDVAVLRLLLAVLHTVVCRYDPQGRESPLRDEDDALERWKVLWERGRLPQEPIRAYLSRWRERFWLFHPERPFYQVNEAQTGTEYGAKKLNGELSESENKYRLFQSYAGAEKDSLSYSQAARWLLYLNGFDDNSGKPKGKGLPSVGAGWLGSLGLILARGKTLDETLLLNLVLLKDGQQLWEPPRPYWELDRPRCGERVRISMPSDQAGLLTLQSRRIILYREEGRVTGYRLLGGDFFEKENAFCEQMTLWRKSQEKKNAPVAYRPARHDPAKQMWREFPAAFAEASSDRLPGIVRWVVAIRELLGNTALIQFEAVGAVYGDKDFFVKDAFSDSLTFHRDLLNAEDAGTISRIALEVNGCEKVAERVGRLARDIDEAAGGSGNGAAEAARERFYFAIDRPFRQWLYELDPEQDVDGAVLAWRKQAAALARRTGRALVEEAGPAALVGRAVKEGTEQAYLAAPKAFNRFLKELSDYEKGRYAT